MFRNCLVEKQNLGLIHNYYLTMLTWLTCPDIPKPDAKKDQECLLGVGKMYTAVLLSIVPCLESSKQGTAHCGACAKDKDSLVRNLREWNKLS